MRCLRCTALALSAGSALGQAPIVPVAIGNTQVPGAPIGVRYSLGLGPGAPWTPSIDGAGHAYFMTFIAGPGIGTSNNTAMIGPDASGATALLYQSGAPAPGLPGATLGLLALNRFTAVQDRQFAFAAGVSQYDGAVWRPGPVLVARGGQPAPGGGGDLFDGFSVPRLDRLGRIAFIGQTVEPTYWLPVGAGLWKVGAGGVVSTIAYTGNAAPGAASTFGNFHDCRMSDGRLSFYALLEDYRRGVWVTTGAWVPELRYLTGAQAAGAAPGVVLGDVRSFDTNAAGRLVVHGSVYDTNTSLGGDGVWVSDATGDLRPLVIAGAQAPGLEPGATVEMLGRPLLNARGEILLYSTVTQGGVRSGALWMFDPSGRPGVLARSGWPAPGAPSGTRFQWLRASALNNAGQAALLVWMDLTSRMELWSYDPGRGLARIAQPGDTVSIGGGQAATLNEFYLTEDSGGQDGMPAALNDQGDLVFGAAFVPTHPGAGIFKTRVAAGCYANCDGSTTTPVLNVSDFACYVNRFAAGDVRANCDLSGVSPYLNALDFVCFLNKFAAGCS